MAGLDIRFPNITATTTDGKMSQMQSYMHQLVEQLNWALSTVDNAIQGNTSNVVVASQKAQNSEEEAVDTFNSIKALIIKSADIVTAYEETMRKDFSGEYVAVSDFGTYTQKTDLAIEENSLGVNELYTNVQNIGVQTDGKTENDERATKVLIKRGYLGDDEKGNAVYGMSVGEYDENDAYKKYAWFTANRLSFFDINGIEVAYISDRKLYITDAAFVNATFSGSVTFYGAVKYEGESGGYKTDNSNGLAFLWVDKEGG